MDEASSWTSVTAPSSTSDLQFSSVGAVTASLNDDFTVNSLTLKNSDLTFALGDKTLTVSSASTLGGTGTFNLTSGSLIGMKAWSAIGDGKPLTMNVCGDGTYLELYGGSLGSQNKGHSITISDHAVVKGTSHLAAISYGHDSTLVVDNATLCMTNWQYNSRLYALSDCVGSKVIVRNGGQINVPNDYLSIGQSARGHNNEMLVTGEGTTCIVNQAYLGNAGASNTLYVVDGAEFVVTARSLNTYIGKTATAIDTHVIVSNATIATRNPDRWSGVSMANHSLFEVCGSNSLFETGQLIPESGSVFRAFDGARVKLSNLTTVGNQNGGDSHMILSNVVVETIGSVYVGSSDNGGNVTNSSFDVCGGTRIVPAPYTNFFVGRKETDDGNSLNVYGEGSIISNSNVRFYVGTLAPNEILRVFNGGKVFGGALEVGSATAENLLGSAVEISNDGLVQLDKNVVANFYRGSTLSVRNGTFMGMTGNGTLNLADDATLHLAGTNSHVRVRILNLNGGSGFEFSPPDGGERGLDPFVEVTNAVNSDGTAKLKVVDILECGRNGGGVYTLLFSGTVDLSGLTFSSVEMPRGCRLIRETHAVKVWIPNLKATLITIR